MPSSRSRRHHPQRRCWPRCRSVWQASIPSVLTRRPMSIGGRGANRSIASPVTIELACSMRRAIRKRALADRWMRRKPSRGGENGVFELTGEKILASFGRYAGMFFSTAKVDPSEMPGCGVVEVFLRAADGAGRRDPQRLGRFRDAVDRESYGPISLRPGRGRSRISEFHPDRAAADLLVRALYRHSSRVRRGDRRELSTPAPASAALRVRLSDAQMREESLRAYLHETARVWKPGAGQEYAARVLRTKTYVTQEATRLCAELFALSGGRHYTRNGRLARTLAAAFAGTALRPPLPLALETLLQQFAAD